MSNAAVMKPVQYRSCSLILPSLYVLGRSSSFLHCVSESVQCLSLLPGKGQITHLQLGMGCNVNFVEPLVFQNTCKFLKSDDSFTGLWVFIYYFSIPYQPNLMFKHQANIWTRSAY
jgi:hypothetical protein